MKKTTMVALSLIAVIMAVSGCATPGGKTPNDPASKFIGKWSEKKYSPDGSEWNEDSTRCIRIYKNEDNYILESKGVILEGYYVEGRLVLEGYGQKLIAKYDEETGEMTLEGIRGEITYVKAQQQ